MNNFPFDTAGLDNAAIDNFNNTYLAIRNNFNIEHTGDIDFKLEGFEVFRNCLEVTIRDSFVIKHPRSDAYMLFIDTRHKGIAAKGVVADDYYLHHTWALAYLKRDLGRVLIRPETLRDKIIELIHPIELDFSDDKAFSNTFYVIANDLQKAVDGIDRNFRNAVMDIREDDFIIEVVDHTLLIGSHHPIPADKALHMAEFVNRLAALC